MTDKPAGWAATPHRHRHNARPTYDARPERGAYPNITVVPGEVPAERRRRRRSLGWLLIIPLVAPLLTPFTNRVSPQLWGIPFFYWYQLLCCLLAVVVITTVFLRSRSAGSGRRG